MAILGLEVTGQSATDQKAIRAADELTKELRREAQRDSGPYELAPNSNKTLLDIKMLSECSDEGLKCMSEIGQQMGAERLIYGKLEKKKGGYEVSLKLLNTETRKSEGTTSVVIPLAEIPGGLARRARSLYGRLIGAPEEGGLEITSNAERGTVFVDGEIKTSLSAGSARVSGLSAGSHTVAIEADGFERFETDVSIGAGDTESLRASLVPLGGDGDDDDEGRPGGGWRIAFWSGVVAAGVGGGGWAYSGLQVLSAQDDVDSQSGRYPEVEDIDDNPNDMKHDDACVAFRAHFGDGAENPLRDPCDRGESHQKLVNYLWVPVTIGAAVFSGFAYYKGYIQPKKVTSERAARRNRRRGKQRNFVVTPALGPDLIGAGLGIQF
ncbi:MAG TPA: PEGA domain-containing protein [Kofleriaceae bacterium]|nr:PEGA domain-containing protein [Kofleriaceae bacterium]